jgi:hypothetical protein
MMKNLAPTKDDAALRVREIAFVVREGMKKGAGRYWSRHGEWGAQAEALRFRTEEAARTAARAQGGRLVPIVSGYKAVAASYRKTLDSTLRIIERQGKLIAKLKGAH